MRGFLKFSFFLILWPSEISNFVQNCNFSRFWTKFEISDGHKIKKNENFKNPRITFLYHLDIYLYEQIQLNRTGSFLKFGQFMLKIAIFSAKGDFPIFCNTAFSACKTKVSIIERHNPIIERRKTGLQHIKMNQNLFFGDWTPLYP